MEHSLKELIGARLAIVRIADGLEMEATCLAIDGPMIKLADDGKEGWFSLSAFYSIMKVGPNSEEAEAMAQFGLVPSDYTPIDGND